MPEAVPKSDATKSQMASTSEVTAGWCRQRAAQRPEVERDQRGAALQVEQHMADAGDEEEVGHDEFAVELVATAMQNNEANGIRGHVGSIQGRACPAPRRVICVREFPFALRISTKLAHLASNVASS